jgi:DNA-binding NarL/FixJ family response regulator
MRPISVLLVDDNRILLREIARFLQAESRGEVMVVGSVSEGREAITRATAAQPEVVLLDLNMPDIPGMVILPRLREQMPEAIIVVLTMMDREGVRQASLQTGADGFVSKAYIERDLLPTIRRLVSSMRGPEYAISVSCPNPTCVSASPAGHSPTWWSGPGWLCTQGESGHWEERVALA